MPSWNLDAIHDGGKFCVLNTKEQEAWFLCWLMGHDRDELRDLRHDRSWQNSGRVGGQHIWGGDTGWATGYPHLQHLCSICHLQVIQVLQLCGQQFNADTGVGPDPKIPFAKEDDIAQQLRNGWYCQKTVTNLRGGALQWFGSWLGFPGKVIDNEGTQQPSHS